ncbi:hypothetical protein AB6C43_08300 [Vibrio splendidus]
MPEYLCENCTIAYCFDDCCSPLAQKDMIEVEELVHRFDVEHDDEKSEQDIEDSSLFSSFRHKKSPQAKLVGIWISCSPVLAFSSKGSYKNF